jgi:acyl-coenzyme A thioesterase PaaI-like protein
MSSTLSVLVAEIVTCAEIAAGCCAYRLIEPLVGVVILSVVVVYVAGLASGDDDE